MKRALLSCLASVNLENERDRVLDGMNWSIGEALAIVEGDLAGHIYLGAPPEERGEAPPQGAIPIRVSAIAASNAVVQRTSGEAGPCAGEELDGLLEIQLTHETWGVIAEGSAEVLLSEEAQYESFLEFSSTLDSRVFDELGMPEEQRPMTVEFRGHTIFAVVNEGPKFEHYGRLTDADDTVEMPEISLVWAPSNE
jgi:hypothetical protein